MNAKVYYILNLRTSWKHLRLKTQFEMFSIFLYFSDIIYTIKYLSCSPTKRRWNQTQTLLQEALFLLQDLSNLTKLLPEFDDDNYRYINYVIWCPDMSGSYPLTLPEMGEEELIALINWIYNQIQLIKNLIKQNKQIKQVPNLYKPILVKKKHKHKQKTCSPPKMRKSLEDSLVDAVAVRLLLALLLSTKEVSYVRNIRTTRKSA